MTQSADVCYYSQLKGVFGRQELFDEVLLNNKHPACCGTFVLCCLYYTSSLRLSPICSVHRPMFKPRQRRSSVESDVFASDEEDMRSSPAQHNPAQLSVIDQWADQDPFSSVPCLCCACICARIQVADCRVFLHKRLSQPAARGQHVRRGRTSRA